MIHLRTILARSAVVLLLCAPLALTQTAQLEKSLESNPDDLAIRTQLLAKYQNATTEASRKARLQHLTWLIEHHPESELFTKDVTRLVPDDFAGQLQEEKRAILVAWYNQIKAHPEDVTIAEYALRNLNQVDYTASVEILKGLRRLEPTNPRWAFLLAGLYEGAITNQQLSQRAFADLGSSNDLAVVGMTGQDLYLMGRNGGAASLAQYGESLLKRAQEIDPMSPRWATANAAKSPVLTEADMWPYGKVPKMPIPNGAVDMAPDQLRLIHSEAPVCMPAPKLPCPQSRTFLTLDVVIGRDGKVKHIHAQAGPVNLIPPAMDAIRRWTFRPTLVYGQPVEVVTQLEAIFGPSPTSTKAAPAAAAQASPITGPVPINRPEPLYTEEAHKAGFTGTVMVSLTVDATGQPRDVKVVRPAGLGLDERAIEAVRKWTFKPAMKDGKPIAVPATVEVNFKTR